MSAHDDHDYASTQSFRLSWWDVPESPGPFSHEVHDHGFCAVHVLRRARQENDPGNVRQMIDQHLGVILTKFNEVYWEIGNLKNISSVLKSIQNCLNLTRLIFQWMLNHQEIVVRNQILTTIRQIMSLVLVLFNDFIMIIIIKISYFFDWRSFKS